MEQGLAKFAAATWLVAQLVGCGGGGASGAAPAPVADSPSPPVAPAPAPVPAPAPAPAPMPIGPMATPEAAKLLAIGTFGASLADVRAAEGMSTDAWLDAQFAVPPTFHAPVLDSLFAQLDQFPEDGEPEGLSPHLFRRYAWWHNALTAPDQLRQRVAFALSEIFVVSDLVEEISDDARSLTTYQDLLVANAFGNFRDLLRDVTYSPAMGLYLSHVNNRKADPVANTFPDENYAREVMQLFTIGLFELDPDGTRRLDAAGRPVPTYGNREIRGLARVFTGLTYDCSDDDGEDATNFIGRSEPCFALPMTVIEAAHETGTKTLVSGVTLPGGQSTREDVAQALDVLFAHPNVGPFIGRQLIQRLVTSNPSPAYVARVAAAFDGDGVTPRGDMKIVIRAVLTDPEALRAADPASPRGKLTEPLLRYAALARQFDARIDGGFFAISGFLPQQFLSQHPLSAPSVFNFYLPDHRPTGAITEAGLVAPEFQITTASTIVNATNLMLAAVHNDGVFETETPFGTVSLDFTDWIARADDPQALLDTIDVVFTAGTMTPNTRAAIADAIAGIDLAEDRALVALYLTLISPDYAVRI